MAGEVLSEAGEDGEDAGKGGAITVEAKTFSWFPSDGMSVLKESHN